MTAPNTEPISATDRQVDAIKAGLAKAFPARTAPDLAAQMVLQILIARIEQEREMRRELARVLEKTTNKLQAVRMSGDGRALAVIQTANLALARAAKMEPDNAR